MSYTYYPVFDDMLESHLLIAGKTGSGKSVCLHNLIYHAMFKSPNDFKIALIDPKKVELNRYRNISHCIGYADDIVSIRDLLLECEYIMMSRYESMKKRGLNLWDGPTLYIFIDEYADLVLTDKKRIEPIIQRIGQLGRAAKVFCCIATQYINGIIDTKIRCNFDRRICLHTATKSDSIKILDRPGCELLPPFGQMYYIGKYETVRYNVPMVPDNDIYRLIDHWTPKPLYKTILKKLTGL